MNSAEDDTSNLLNPDVKNDGGQNSQTGGLDLIADIINSSLSTTINEIPVQPVTEVTESVALTVVPEASEETAPSTSGTSVQSSIGKCPECGSKGENMQYTKSIFKPKNKSQVCWIYRAKCSNQDCGAWFGDLKRFERNCFITVNEDGRPMGRRQIMEKRAEKNGNDQASTSSPCKEEENEDEPVQVEKEKEAIESSSQMSEAVKEEDSTVPSPKKSRTTRKTSRKKRATLTVVKNRAQKKRNSIEAEKQARYKPKQPQKQKGYVYIVEQDGVEQELIVEGPSSSSSRSKDKKQKVEPPKKVDKRVSKQEKKPRSSSSCNVATKSPDSGTIVIQQDLTLLLAKNKGVACEVQTGEELLMKSNLMETIFYQQLSAKIEPSISARLKDQPKMVIAHFLVMAKTIEKLSKKIEEHEEEQKKTGIMKSKVQELISHLHLMVSETLRASSDDVAILAKEMQTYHLETLSIQRKQNAKLQKFNDEAQKKFDDYELRLRKADAVLKVKTKEWEYEKERAEYYLYVQEKHQSARYRAEEVANMVNKKLENQLFLTSNQKCAKCKIVEQNRTALIEEMAEITLQRDKAREEKDELDIKVSKVERCAQILGADVDKLKYEVRTWKSVAEKSKSEITRLNDLVRELKASRSTPRLLDTPAATPRPNAASSLHSTPSIFSEQEKVSPTEYNEKSNSPPEELIVEKKKEEVVPEEEEEKKKNNGPVPIAAGFASWIPKDKLHAPAPEIPRTAVDPFGVPLKLKAAQPETRYNLPPSQVPTPWEKPLFNPSPSGNVSSALAEVAARVEAEAFLGTIPLSSSSRNGRSPGQHQQREKSSYHHQDKKEKKNKRNQPEAMSDDDETPHKKKKKDKKKNRKEREEVSVKQQQNGNHKVQSSLIPSTSAVAGPSGSSASSGTTSGEKSVYGGSLSKFNKIPKKSDKPPQAEFASALGIKNKDGYKGIPGLSLLEEKEKEVKKEEEKKKNDRIEEEKKITEKLLEIPKSNPPMKSSTPPPGTSGANKNANRGGLPKVPNTIAPAERLSIQPIRSNSNQKNNPFGIRSPMASPQQAQRRAPPVAHSAARPFQDTPWSDRYSSWTESPPHASSRATFGQPDSFSALPWHRDSPQNQQHQAPHRQQPAMDPFGRVNVREEGWNHMTPNQYPHPPHQQQLPPRPTYSYFGNPFDQPQQNRNPNEKRSFWD